LRSLSGFRDGLDTHVLVICGGSMPTQLLPALGYACTVATPFAVVIHNGLLAYVVAISATVVICIVRNLRLRP
jgi:hypothetical protein